MSEAHEATSAVLEVTRPEAFQIVLDSPTWADRRQATIEANDAFWVALKEEADEFVDDGVTMTATFDLTKRQPESDPHESRPSGGSQLLSSSRSRETRMSAALAHITTLSNEHAIPYAVLHAKHQRPY